MLAVKRSLPTVAKLKSLFNIRILQFELFKSGGSLPELLIVILVFSWTVFPLKAPKEAQ